MTELEEVYGNGGREMRLQMKDEKRKSKEGWTVENAREGGREREEKERGGRWKMRGKERGNQEAGVERGIERGGVSLVER